MARSGFLMPTSSEISTGEKKRASRSFSSLARCMRLVPLLISASG
jgi:hypothetical protein